MAAYIFGTVQSISDPAQFTEYQGLAGPILAQYGGKVLGGGAKIEVADGNWSPIGVFAAEFESLQKAKEWYNSPEYQALISKRLNATQGGLVFVDGG